MRSILALALVASAGCTNVAAPPAEVSDRKVIYQAIADALPRADLGFGDPPGIIYMTRSVKAEPKPPEPDPLRCNERGFMVHFAVFHPRAQWIPYAALKQASWGWVPFPNVLFAPLVVVPYQVVAAEVVVDAKKVPGLLERIEEDCKRLERVSRELGMGGPYSHAIDVRNKLAADAAEHGPGSLVIEFGYGVPVPAWLPADGPAKNTAQAFAWAQAHPDEPALPEAEKPAAR